MESEKKLEGHMLNLANLHESDVSELELTARMQQAEDELARFFNQSLDLLCIADFDGHFKRLNRAWTTLLGWPLEELQSSLFMDFVHPDDREATLLATSKLSVGVEAIRFENRYRHNDGSYRWLQWNAHPDPDDQLIHANARDVTRQKRLEREVLESVDQERERLGRELHDGLCQTLAGIAALSSTLSRKLARGSETAASAAAHEINTLLNEAIGETRGLSRCLSPQGMNEIGLVATLEALALNIKNRFGVSCTLDSDIPMVCLGHEVEAHLYRIAQEAVSNAVTHGRARQIEISLSIEYGEGLLCVNDDGVGVPEAVGAPEGIGMHTMAYRARLIGGTLEVRRRATSGTAVSCAFPTPRAHDMDEIPDYDRDDS